MKNLFKKIKRLALLSSIYPNEDPVREFIETELENLNKDYILDEFGNLYISSTSDILLSAHMDKQEAPNFKDLGDEIQGKLDDAVGIGIILTLAEKFDFHAFFTVGEEVGLLGSEFALENELIPDACKAIIVDTSSLGEMGKGPIFYKSFGSNLPSVEYINEIYSSAKSAGVTLQPFKGVINDGVNIIKAIPNTIALEPHIDNFHTSYEISAKKDIEDTYKVLEHILKRDI